ncbi:hypothetical protein AALP_AA8G286900 [Arabis alpina]|uniref:Uncharacterized protein n=1 Tax=Arabis alpina TaxID=50452 RepID=A0A087GA38_ARAAL|nr:hypothetical protein AALP_AA8G286900 [Arabis alpina]
MPSEHDRTALVKIGIVNLTDRIRWLEIHERQKLLSSLRKETGDKLRQLTPRWYKPSSSSEDCPQRHPHFLAEYRVSMVTAEFFLNM